MGWARACRTCKTCSIGTQGRGEGEGERERGGEGGDIGGYRRDNHGQEVHCSHHDPLGRLSRAAAKPRNWMCAKLDVRNVRFRSAGAFERQSPRLWLVELGCMRVNARRSLKSRQAVILRVDLNVCALRVLALFVRGCPADTRRKRRPCGPLTHSEHKNLPTPCTPWPRQTPLPPTH